MKSSFPNIGSCTFDMWMGRLFGIVGVALTRFSTAAIQRLVNWRSCIEEQLGFKRMIHRVYGSKGMKLVNAGWCFPVGCAFVLVQFWLFGRWTRVVPSMIPQLFNNPIRSTFRPCLIILLLLFCRVAASDFISCFVLAWANGPLPARALGILLS
jgi:hypothetical protein